MLMRSAALKDIGVRRGPAICTAQKCVERKNDAARSFEAAGRVKMIPAITYFRTFRHYHRLKGLNGRVRNGNECFPLGKVTGKKPGRGVSRVPGLYQNR